VFGRLADMLGRKLLYCGGFVVFITSAGLGGLAPSLGHAGWRPRAAGLGGAGLLSANSVAIRVGATAQARRGRALGWRWVFWINLPVGLLGAVLGLLVLPRTERPAGSAAFDLPGAALLVPSLGLSTFALKEAAHAGCRSPWLIGPILVGLLLLIGFVRREQRTISPMFDL
jgi:MFS family permease